MRWHIVVSYSKDSCSVFAASEFILSIPLLRLEAVQRAVAGVNVDASDAHVSAPVGVVEDRAGASLPDGSIAAG
jgi:hypothetical protein